MVRKDNELAVDMNEIMSEAMVKEDAALEPAEEPIDIPEEFLEETSEVEIESSPAPTPTPSSKSVPSTSNIKYKANGEEFTASEEEARKALSLAKGARKAFSDLAEAKKKLKNYENAEPELNRYKEFMAKLQELGSDDYAVYKMLTGRDLRDVIQQEATYRTQYEVASDEERRIMDYERKFKEMENKQKLAEQRMKAKEDEQLKLADSNKRSELTNVLVPTFNKFTSHIESKVPNLSSTIKEMYWTSSVEKIKRLAKDGYEVTPKLVNYVFNQNAKVLINGHQNQVATGVKEVTSKRSQVAKQKAEAASQKNYENPEAQKLSKKNPLDLFKTLFRKEE